MTTETVNANGFQSIGNPQLGSTLQKPTEKPDIAMFDNAPNDVSIGSFFGKIFIGIIVGLCVAALLFGALTAIGGMTGTDDGQVNSILKFLLPIVGFVVSFVGNLVLALMYNMFFSKRYYSFGKMFGLIFVSSIILLVFFIIIYVLYEKISELYLILGLQIAFSLYISLNLIDFLSQPNYSASSLMGNTLGYIIAVVAHLGIMSFIVKGRGDYVIMPTIISSIIIYTLIVLGAGIWDAIYYKFYEWGNNPFYLPSLNELREERQKEELKKQEEEEDVNVDMK